LAQSTRPDSRGRAPRNTGSSRPRSGGSRPAAGAQGSAGRAKPVRSAAERLGDEPPAVKTKKKKKKQPKSPLWARLFIIFGGLMVVASGGTLVGGQVLIAHYSSAITHEGGLGSAAASGTSIDGPLNLLLVGIDERTGNAAMGARADSIIIAHVPASHDAVYLTSIPRDTRVQIPAYPRTRYGGGTAKINAAFQFGYANGGGRDGGLELLAETVKNLAGGLNFNGAAIVNFDGFSGLVKAIGGVDMCVDEKTTSIHTGWNIKTGKEGQPYNINSDGTPNGLRAGMRPMVYEVGCRHMASWEALDYVRQRDLLANNDADYGRQRHQQQFIKAMMKQTMSAGVLTNPIKVNQVLNSVGQAVSFYNNKVSIANWIFTLKGISPDQMVTLKTNGGAFNPVTIGGESYEELDDSSRQLLAAITSDTVQTFIGQHPDFVSNDASTPATKPTTPAR
jgi:polyisoprenyl-teichoic acid--peptidoglycan teichoic acid transferase